MPKKNSKASIKISPDNSSPGNILDIVCFYHNTLKRITILHVRKP